MCVCIGTFTRAEQEAFVYFSFHISRCDSGALKLNLESISCFHKMIGVIATC